MTCPNCHQSATSNNIFETPIAEVFYATSANISSYKLTINFQQYVLRVNKRECYTNVHIKRTSMSNLFVFSVHFNSGL